MAAAIKLDDLYGDERVQQGDGVARVPDDGVRFFSSVARAQHLLPSERAAEVPRLRLDPMFADADGALLGREDFFRAFTITFQEHAATPVYHLEPA